MNAMQTPTKARRILPRSAMTVVATILLAACARDVTAPAATKLAPTDAQKALVGVVDGVYSITINPSYSYTLPLGKSYMTLPANAICKLGTSGYGSAYWNTPCTPETNPVTITAIVRGAQTDNPSVDFNPPMRFNPSATVTLHIYVSDAATLSNMTVMKYCSSPFLPSCVDESLTDPTLFTSVDASQGLVFRRIKHFSGYLIAE